MLMMIIGGSKFTPLGHPAEIALSVEKGVDHLGRLSLFENVLGEECRHDLGFGESHCSLQFP